MHAGLRVLFSFGCATAIATAQQPTVDLPTLLKRMTDVDWLWHAPQPGERCIQFSSYDRASDSGPQGGQWFANHDRGHYLREIERDGVTEHVMVDVDGPGCLTRLWSANPEGTLHFDIDGERVWSVDFGELCSGQVDGVAEPLAGMRSRGGNVYLPIPFRQHLTVSATHGDLYYLADVALLGANTDTVSFSPALLAKHAAVVGVTAKQLLPREDAELEGSQPSWSEVEIKAGKVLREFTVVLPPIADRGELGALLQRVLLIIRAGEEETVRVPLTDFFAAGREWRSHNGRFLVSKRDVAVCSFPMPMPKGGQVRLEADGVAGKLPRIGSVTLGELPAQAHPLLFRANYHLAKGTPTRPFSHHVVLNADGTGRFVGCSLLINNPSRIWWGEGDEKFWVDGEDFPSWFGTGTEDYFGYAWCDPTPFEAPFHAQVQCDGPMNFGFTQLHRTHVLDSVPFQRSFRFELERWHWIADTTTDYATVAYWYGAPGASAGLPPVPAADARQLDKAEHPPVFIAPGALEGEQLEVVTCSNGTHEIQDLGVFERTFSRDAHRWWRDGRPGDALVLKVPVKESGRYRVTAALTKANDFGIVQLSLAGKLLGQPFDGYAPSVQTSGPMSLGIVELAAGDALLRLELTGKNEQALDRHMVGLDYIHLDKVK